MTVSYAREETLSVSDFAAVLNNSGLGLRRPVDDPNLLQKMLENADLTVVARDQSGKIIGVARSITDWCYALYCSDLAVDRAFQGQGIGKKLLQETVRHAPEVKNHILLSAPDAVSFYAAAGCERHTNAFLFNQIKSQ